MIIKNLKNKKKLLMSKIKLSSKNLSNEDINKYSLEYGVNVRKEDNNLVFSGDTRDVDRVIGMIKREQFLEKNKNNKNNYKSQPGSISSKLDSINLEKDYDRINNSSGYGNKNYSSSINFTI